jgi:hypothetical protein
MLRHESRAAIRVAPWLLLAASSVRADVLTPIGTALSILLPAIVAIEWLVLWLLARAMKVPVRLWKALLVVAVANVASSAVGFVPGLGIGHGGYLRRNVDTLAWAYVLSVVTEWLIYLCFFRAPTARPATALPTTASRRPFLARLFGLCVVVNLATYLPLATLFLSAPDPRALYVSSRALSDVRTVLATEDAFQRASGGPFGDLECLRAPVRCLPGYEGPVFISEGFVTDGQVQAGYRRRFHCSPSRDAQATDAAGLCERYAYAVWPELADPRTPAPAYCGDHTGVVRFRNDGAEPKVADGACDTSDPILP